MNNIRNLTASIIVLIIFFFAGCTENNHYSGKFTTDNDTLILETRLVKGNGLFKIGTNENAFRDTNEWKSLDIYKNYPDYQVTYPNDLSDLRLGFFTLMFDTLRFYNLADNKAYTQENFTLFDRQLLMVTGERDGVKVLIADANHNADLRDDSVLNLVKWDWHSEDNLVKLHYTIKFNDRIVTDSGWIKIGTYEDVIFTSSCQHYIAEFSIDSKEYQLGVADENTVSFCFFRPVLYPFMEEGIIRDTLIMKDIIKPGEYVRLGKNYYRFDKFYNGSGTIVLTRERNFDGLTGTLPGMLAPAFSCINVNGDTLKCTDLCREKPLLLANISGCTPDSYNQYSELRSACLDSLNIIALESAPNGGKKSNVVDVELEFNQDIYREYRNAYSNYDCYLIGMDGRIKDKFSIFDWKVNLDPYRSDKGK